MLSEHPMCEVCKIFVSSEVHHIIPVCDGGTNARKNLVTLCRTCHKYVPGKDPDGYTEEFEIYKKAGGILWHFFRMGFVLANATDFKAKDYIDTIKQSKKARKVMTKHLTKHPLKMTGPACIQIVTS